MYPIAWAVIGTESKFTWKRFMTILQDYLNLGDGSQITIISDMQNGLIAVADEVFPKCEHKMCARHILTNWSQNWRGIERRKKFWACARSTFEAEVKYNINALSKLGTGIVEALIKYNKEKWCKAFFQTFSKCDSIDNNMAESFKAWILGPRNKTIVTMLEEIRVKVMSKCNIEWNGDDGFEVLEGVYKHTVNLGQQKCSYRSWELKGIPCAHGITAINHLNMDASQAISSWCRKETYLKTYSHFIQPVLNMEMWPESRNLIAEPPEARQMPGRPPKNIRREIGEVRKVGKGANHNKRNCPKNPKPKSTPTPTQESFGVFFFYSHSSSTGKKRGRGQYERASSSNTGTKRDAGSGYKKRPKVVGQGQGLSSSMRANTGVVSSAHVTGDIGFKPTKGLKWKGKQAMTQRELQVQSVMHHIQTR
ncbi:hypothetical protein KY289_030288 [Solanum tuberosum]|nr:hypothetical protein KY289_030288 [Solanum tuberosum]